jgi:F1F0 ATPase subunit 2
MVVGELARWVLLAAAGGLLGSVYFGGLWLTVRRLPHADHPAALVLGSFVLRAVLVAAGFAWLLAGDPLRLVAVLVGFLAVRVLLVRQVRPGAASGGGARP